MSDNRDEIIKKIIEVSADMGGSAVAGAIGFLAGGPLGAAVVAGGGVAIKEALKCIGYEIGSSLLAPNEKRRVGTVYTLAVNEIRERIDNGEGIRNDDFFEKKENDRSDADQVLESIILKVQRDPEEKKIKYMAHLMANLVFDENFSAETAYTIIKFSEQLTYRQLCLLCICASTKEERKKRNLRNKDYRDEKRALSKEHFSLLYEFLELCNNELIFKGLTITPGEFVSSLADINPFEMRIQGIGTHIFNLMKLEEIPEEDIMHIIKTLEQFLKD